LEEVRQRVAQALKEVYDPEIPVNVYDLGLVYQIDVEESGGGYSIRIVMGVTTPFCPVTSLIAWEVERVVRERVPEAKEVSVELTLDPPWTPERVTPEGREQLKAIYGYDIVEEMLKRASA